MIGELGERISHQETAQIIPSANSDHALEQVG
jgi:hypothetical protein